MGRKKIQIQRITDERNKQVTFTKRKFGLMKKAYELSVLCDCEIALIIFNHANKLFQYASTDMDKVLLKYTEYNEPHESRTNADIIETLRKKGFNGCDSPEPDGEDSIDQSPLNDDKYRKTTEDLDVLFKRYGQSTAPPQTFSMPVTVQASNQSTLQFSNPGSALVTTSYVTSSSLTDTHLLSPQQPALQRNTVSPGLPQRPASAGALLGGDLNNSNGGCPSPVPNGYTSARASPGLLTVSNGNSLGKVVPAKSPPPPPSPQMVNSRKPDLRVITSQGGKSLMQMTEDELELVNENAQRLAAGAQTLTTPVVSVATPSLLAQGLPFSAMPTAYNTEYQLTSADITALHALASPGGLLPTGVSTWQQQTVSQPSQQQQQQTQQQLNLASLSNLVMWGVDKQSSELSSQVSSLAANLSVGSPSNLLLGRDEWLGRPVTNIPQGAMLTVNTNSGVSIKSEPISPGRDRSTPCPPPSTTPSSTSGGTILTAPPQYPGSLLCLEPPTGRSPADSVSSNASSFEGSDRDDAGAAGGGTAGAGGGGGGAGGGGGSSAGPTSRSVPPDFSPSAELLRASNEQDQEGGNIKRMRLDAWVT
ncbi:myocyte-specific enhancer factor 2D homolog isoform X1 [Simochromis diagramma]|uniref:myocyte-specific enhancer factor 2D homolog isoform X1 n=1 Tax=Simochromis diagramma TaxID=43689 RepID=UPI001A7E4120|nr:myocyte-specific enhancer factor 2D homolog isoform X1 [Simochromis diagramma]XP_039877465.1 myocyte-specific enhancer factor 2D homolog isoform X1 [Simochromis diagramma]XP_039877467.1 myocyte-specific enhancer factor 2D homolog isoform X1 [Simochromis diagramma]